MVDIPGSESGTAEDVHWMRHALSLAERAEAAGEVPVGAVLVRAGTLLAEGWNQPIAVCDPTAHAEIIALRAGAAAEANYRLGGTTLYVTLEPCSMCVGALIHARVDRLVLGATDPKSGAAGSVFSLLQACEHNHRVACTSGVLAEASAALLRRFFRQRR